MSATHVLITMKTRQRRTLRKLMAEALRDRHFQRYDKLEKKHRKLADSIVELQAKALRTA